MNIDLLLGQHVLLLARTSEAVLASRTPEFDGYGDMVHENAEAIATLIAEHANQPGASQTVAPDQEAWDEAYLDYVTAAFDQSASGKASASAGLQSAATEYATALASLAGVPSASARRRPSPRRCRTSPPWSTPRSRPAPGPRSAYQALQTAYAQTQSIGDALADGLAHRGHVQGSGDTRAVDLRVAVDMQLQEQVALDGFAASGVAGRALRRARRRRRRRADVGRGAGEQPRLDAAGHGQRSRPGDQRTRLPPS